MEMTKDDIQKIAHAIATANNHPEPDSWSASVAAAYAAENAVTAPASSENTQNQQ